jgi:hypothetical protein
MKEGLRRAGRVPRVRGVGDELEAGAAHQSDPSVVDVHILREVQVDAHRRRAGFFRVDKDDLANVRDGRELKQLRVSRVGASDGAPL